MMTETNNIEMSSGLWAMVSEARKDRSPRDLRTKSPRELRKRAALRSSLDVILPSRRWLKQAMMAGGQLPN